MFTGIIKAMGEVTSVTGDGVKRFTLRTPFGFLRGAKLGASIAIDGVCLTLVRKGFRRAEFDVMDESLRITTLGQIQVGDVVNLERSFRVGDEIGGHIVSGHVSCMAKIIDRREENGTTIMRFKLPKGFEGRVEDKGFIAIDGASLTVTNYDEQSGEFNIFFIPETLHRTRFGSKGVGDKVNIEYYHAL